jgi:hypothetical protein
MESLAILVAIIFLFNLLAGPLAIALTWSKLVKAIASQSRVLALILTIFRRLTHGLLVSIGIFIGGWIVVIAEPPAKLFGLFSMVTSYIALRREYFPDLHLFATIGNKLGIRKVGPGDHGPKFKGRKNGRSSGDDGYGPEGQH